MQAGKHATPGAAKVSLMNAHTVFVIYVIVMCSIFYEAERRRRRRLTTLAPAHYLPVRATQTEA